MVQNVNVNIDLCLSLSCEIFGWLTILGFPVNLSGDWLLPNIKRWKSSTAQVVYATWIFGQTDYLRILGQSLVPVTTVGTYIEWHHINHFSANKCQHFEGTGRTLWIVLVPYNAFKGFPSVPCEQEYFVSKKKYRFLSTFSIKQQRRLTNLTNATMVGYYCFSCL